MRMRRANFDMEVMIQYPAPDDGDPRRSYSMGNRARTPKAWFLSALPGDAGGALRTYWFEHIGGP